MVGTLFVMNYVILNARSATTMHITFFREGHKLTLCFVRETYFGFTKKDYIFRKR